MGGRARPEHFHWLLGHNARASEAPAAVRERLRCAGPDCIVQSSRSDLLHAPSVGAPLPSERSAGRRGRDARSRWRRPPAGQTPIECRPDCDLGKQPRDINTVRPLLSLTTAAATADDEASIPLLKILVCLLVVSRRRLDQQKAPLFQHAQTVRRRATKATTALGDRHENNKVSSTLLRPFHRMNCSSSRVCQTCHKEQL